MTEKNYLKQRLNKILNKSNTPANVNELFPESKMKNLKDAIKFYSMASTMTKVENDASKMKFEQIELALGLQQDVTDNSNQSTTATTTVNDGGLQQDVTDNSNQSTTATTTVNDGTLWQHALNNSLLNEGSFSSAINIKDNIQTAFNIVFDAANIVKNAAINIVGAGWNIYTNWKQLKGGKIISSFEKQKAILEQFKSETTKWYNEIVEQINDAVNIIGKTQKYKILGEQMHQHLKQIYKQDMIIFKNAEEKFQEILNSLNNIKKEDDFERLSQKDKESLQQIFWAPSNAPDESQQNNTPEQPQPQPQQQNNTPGSPQPRPQQQNNNNN